MNNILNPEFSKFAIYIFLFFCLVLFFTFRLINYVLPLIPFRRGIKKPVLKYLPVFELLVWLLFLIWAVQFFIKYHYWYAIGLFVIIFIILIWVSWFVLKDIIAGIIFRTSENFSVNESIVLKGYSGKIVKFKSRSLELETDSGEHINIPYNIVLSEVVSKSNPAEMIKGHTFKINLSKKSALLQSIENIKTDILNLPWISVKKVPSIKTVDETNEEFVLEITVYSLEKEYFVKIENFIKEKYS